MMDPSLDFWLVSLVPVVPGDHMDPIWLEFEISVILELRPSEIEAPGCPMGPKFLSQNFSHANLSWCYFIGFEDLFGEKSQKTRKTGHLYSFPHY